MDPLTQIRNFIAGEYARERQEGMLSQRPVSLPAENTSELVKIQEIASRQFDENPLV